jgi:hypothetical protein
MITKPLLSNADYLGHDRETAVTLKALHYAIARNRVAAQSARGAEDRPCHGRLYWTRLAQPALPRHREDDDRVLGERGVAFFAVDAVVDP